MLSVAPRPNRFQCTGRAYCVVRPMLSDAGLPGASSQLFGCRQGESVTAASAPAQWGALVLTGWKSDAICNVLAHAN